MNPDPNFESASLAARNGACCWGRESQLEVSALSSMAVTPLLPLFDGTEMLFSRRITLRGRGFSREPASPRRTVIALLGLHRSADSGQRQPFHLPSIEA